jgi:uncharacterized protein (DUF362 family)
MDRNDLIVIYGNDARTMVLDLLEQVQPEQGLDPKTRIGIKPNLVLARRADSGATTSPEMVAGIIEYFQDKGYRNLSILEGSWVGEQTARAFKVCGYEDMSKHYQVPLIDLQRDKTIDCSGGGMDLKVCEQVMQLDYLINVPVLKGHCQTQMTCALKNMKGCIPNSEKRRYHTMGLHRPIACLNTVIHQDLILVDGLMGDLNFEEGGHPVPMNRMIASRDPVLVDSYVAGLMGFTLDEIPYIRMAESLGVGNAELSSANIVELNDDRGSVFLPKPRKLPHTRLIEENEACSACYGSLIHALERMSEHGSLDRLRQKLYIGQYYKGKRFNGIGIGSCTSSFDRCVPGCPPKARDIVSFLEDE